ncbi:hypothetical protein MTBBW1_2870001 [Desulfamplus magnetovallimortis]|uniref:Uncharacterized protein n=1 Tax=Desulfamplus magnetovallimortis TaxID=1246637 RepID=A0A1W1HFQ1_9BACT|nr:hypothetical protein MTBBW1_2870001 [Desulfamplus magnetovallimortis]
MGTKKVGFGYNVGHLSESELFLRYRRSLNLTKLFIVYTISP